MGAIHLLQKLRFKCCYQWEGQLYYCFILSYNSSKFLPSFGKYFWYIVGNKIFQSVQRVTPQYFYCMYLLQIKTCMNYLIGYQTLNWYVNYWQLHEFFRDISQKNMILPLDTHLARTRHMYVIKFIFLYVVRICGIRNNVEHLCNSNLLLYSMYVCTSRNLLQCCTSNSNVVQS